LHQIFSYTEKEKLDRVIGSWGNVITVCVPRHNEGRSNSR
jgi:hypothetical protein